MTTPQDITDANLEVLNEILKDLTGFSLEDLSKPKGPTTFAELSMRAESAWIRYHDTRDKKYLKLAMTMDRLKQEKLAAWRDGGDIVINEKALSEFINS